MPCRCSEASRREASSSGRRDLVVVLELLLADGAGQRAVVAVPRFLLGSSPFLEQRVMMRGGFRAVA